MFATWRKIAELHERQANHYKALSEALLIRNDRLVEALSKREGVPIVMPQSLTPQTLPTILEKSEGWFDVRRPATTSTGGNK